MITLFQQALKVTVQALKGIVQPRMLNNRVQCCFWSLLICIIWTKTELCFLHKT